MYSRFRTAVVNARKNSASNHPHNSSPETGGCLTRSQANLMATLSKPNVTHDAANSEFALNIGHSKAFITYKLDGSVMRMEHTEVPIAFEGKGVGKILAKFAFEHCVQNNLKMQLNCTFLQHYLVKYAPEYTAHVVEKE